MKASFVAFPWQKLICSNKILIDEFSLQFKICEFRRGEPAKVENTEKVAKNLDDLIRYKHGLGHPPENVAEFFSKHDLRSSYAQSEDK